MSRMGGARTPASAEDDLQAIAAYRKAYGVGPFLAADAVVVSRDDRILLIRRSRPPQKGRWALPGGFVDPAETFLEAALRELREETGISLQAADLASCGSREEIPSLLRDAPDRDPRARIVSVAFLLRLKGAAADFTPRAGDDAADAEWVGLDAAMESDAFYADHHDILRGFGLLPEG